MECVEEELMIVSIRRWKSVDENKLEQCRTLRDKISQKHVEPMEKEAAYPKPTRQCWVGGKIELHLVEKVPILFFLIFPDKDE